MEAPDNLDPSTKDEWFSSSLNMRHPLNYIIIIIHKIAKYYNK